MSNNATTTAAWKSYEIGTVVTVADGREFTITAIDEKKTPGGYSSRLFTLRGPNGETVVKTSRGLTLWQAGKSGDGNSTEPQAVVEAEAREVDASLGAAIAAAVESYLSPVGKS